MGKRPKTSLIGRSIRLLRLEDSSGMTCPPSHISPRCSSNFSVSSSTTNRPVSRSTKVRTEWEPVAESHTATTEEADPTAATASSTTTWTKCAACSKCQDSQCQDRCQEDITTECHHPSTNNSQFHSTRSHHIQVLQHNQECQCSHRCQHSPTCRSVSASSTSSR